MVGLAYRYKYTIQWSEEDNAFIAVVKEWPSLAADGTSMEGALLELIKVVEKCIEDMKRDGEFPPIPVNFIDSMIREPK